MSENYGREERFLQIISAIIPGILNFLFPVSGLFLNSISRDLRQFKKFFHVYPHI